MTSRSSNSRTKHNWRDITTTMDDSALDEFNVLALRKYCEQNNLDQTGTKAVLKERVIAFGSSKPKTIWECKTIADFVDINDQALSDFMEEYALKKQDSRLKNIKRILAAQLEEDIGESASKPAAEHKRGRGKKNSTSVHKAKVNVQSSGDDRTDQEVTTDEEGTIAKKEAARMKRLGIKVVLDDFSGEKEDWDKFAEDFEDACVKNPLWKYSDKKKILINHLKGAALMHYVKYSEKQVSANIEKDLEEMREFLSLPKHGTLREVQEFKQRPNEPLAVFASAFRKRADKYWKCIPFPELRTTLLQNLQVDKSVVDQIVFKKPKDLDELLEVVVEVERTYRETMMEVIPSVNVMQVMTSRTPQLMETRTTTPKYVTTEDFNSAMSMMAQVLPTAQPGMNKRTQPNAHVGNGNGRGNNLNSVKWMRGPMNKSRKREWRDILHEMPNELIEDRKNRRMCILCGLKGHYARDCNVKVCNKCWLPEHDEPSECVGHWIVPTVTMQGTRTQNIQNGKTSKPVNSPNVVHTAKTQQLSAMGKEMVRDNSLGQGISPRLE